MLSFTRPSVASLVTLALLVTLCAHPAQAGIISTSDALALEVGSARTTVDDYLAREDVANELAAFGVDPEVARLRAASLSIEELASLAGRIEENPAGGDVISILGVTFLVLLILELVGVIDIFKKV